MRKLHLQRYTPGQRSNHWAVVICFVLAGISGFALFHPALFWLTSLVGGPQWARILHPYLGIAMFVLFLLMFLTFVGANIWRREDSEWLGSAGKLVSNPNQTRMPAVGKYNGGQKLVFWIFTWSLLLLLGSGLLFWQAWFADSVPIWLQRIAVVVHAVSAFALILAAIVHIYAAIWVKGTLHAMVRGTVSTGWAKHHHPLWYREQMQRQTPTAQPTDAA